MTVDSYLNKITTDISKDSKALQKNIEGYKIIENKIQQSNDYLNVLDALEKRLPMSFQKKYKRISEVVKLDYLIGVVDNPNLYKF